MNRLSKRSFLFCWAPVTALAAMVAMAVAGCGQCEALCVSGVTARGMVELQLRDQPELDIELCFGSQCETTKLTYDGEPGVASCAYNVICKMTERADGNADLSVSMPLADQEIDADAEVSVHIKRADNGAVLVDTKAEIEDVSGEEMCGATCHGVASSWSE